MRGKYTSMIGIVVATTLAVAGCSSKVSGLPNGAMSSTVATTTPLATTSTSATTEAATDTATPSPTVTPRDPSDASPAASSPPASSTIATTAAANEPGTGPNGLTVQGYDQLLSDLSANYDRWFAKRGLVNGTDALWDRHQCYLVYEQDDADAQFVYYSGVCGPAVTQTTLFEGYLWTVVAFDTQVDGSTVTLTSTPALGDGAGDDRLEGELVEKGYVAIPHADGELPTFLTEPLAGEDAGATGEPLTIHSKFGSSAQLAMALATIGVTCASADGAHIGIAGLIGCESDGPSTLAIYNAEDPAYRDSRHHDPRLADFLAGFFSGADGTVSGDGWLIACGGAACEPLRDHFGSDFHRQN